MIAAVVITVLVSNLSFHFVENPIRRHRSLRSRSDWVVVLGGCAVVLMSCVLAGESFLYQYRLTLSVTRDRENWYPYAWRTKDPNDTSKICDTKVVDGHFQSKNCTSTSVVRHQLFILGDSHAGAYTTLANELTERLGIDVWLYTEGGCGVANLLRPVSQESACTEFLKASWADIAKHAKPM
jgi:hypothetical protein